MRCRPAILWAALLLAAAPPESLSTTYHGVGIQGDILVAEGKVHFIQADGSLTVLDLGNGDVLLRRKSLKHTGSLQETPGGVLFDGKSVHVEEGRLETGGEESYSGQTSLGSPFENPPSHRAGRREHPRAMRGRVFSESEARAREDQQSFAWLAEFRHFDGRLIQFQSGWVYTVQGYCKDFSSVMGIKVRLGEANLDAFIAHAGALERIVTATLADNLLLIGTDYGKVECIDIKRAESKWIYMSPRLQSMGSFSAASMGRSMADLASIYRRENTRELSNVGIWRLAEGLMIEDVIHQVRIEDLVPQESRPRVVLDPDPTNPFRLLPLWLALAWTGALGPAVLVAGLFLGRRMERTNFHRAWRGFLGFFLSTLTFIFLGGVSYVAMFAMLGTALVLFVVSAACIFLTFRDREPGKGALMLALLMVVSFISPALRIVCGIALNLL